MKLRNICFYLVVIVTLLFTVVNFIGYKKELASVLINNKYAYENCTSLSKDDNNYKKFYSDGPYQDANEEIIEETQKRLGRAHIQDNVGIFNIDEKGINNYLLTILKNVSLH